ncbi:MAG: hypothetical protein MZU97_03595 [Bacillus subtilis]|nr:hypothetical protein [Bacillus subtilis]
MTNCQDGLFYSNTGSACLFGQQLDFVNRQGEITKSIEDVRAFAMSTNPKTDVFAYAFADYVNNQMFFVMHRGLEEQYRIPFSGTIEEIVLLTEEVGIIKILEGTTRRLVAYGIDGELINTVALSSGQQYGRNVFGLFTLSGTPNLYYTDRLEFIDTSVINTAGNLVHADETSLYLATYNDSILKIAKSTGSVAMEYVGFDTVHAQFGYVFAYQIAQNYRFGQRLFAGQRTSLRRCIFLLHRRFNFRVLYKDIRRELVQSLSIRFDNPSLHID